MTRPIREYETTSFDLAVLARDMAEQAGLRSADPWGSGAARTVAEITAAFPAETNHWAGFADAAEAAGVQADLVFAPMRRRLPPLSGGHARPPWFAPDDVAVSPALRVIRVAGGALLHLGHVPLVLAGDRRTVLRDCSSRYAPLLHYVDRDYAAVLDRAPLHAGAVFVLGDDIWPPNVAHWLLDAIPRLAALDSLAEISVAVPPLTAGWQRAALHLCGIADERIIEVGISRALRAETLLVTDDRRLPPHPAFAAAPWALRFLRRTLGRGAVGQGKSGGGLYVSRGDSTGRRVVNEAALMDALAPRGFKRVELSALDLSGQVAAFADAGAIVASHGAGLAHLAFAAPGTPVVEIFPATHGTPAFALIAASLGLRYRCLVCDDLVAAERPEFVDLRVDPAAVLAALG